MIFDSPPGHPGNPLYELEIRGVELKPQQGNGQEEFNDGYGKGKDPDTVRASYEKKP